MNKVAKKLMEDEVDAIYAYTKAIEDDPDNAELYKHIMEEEIEHYRELAKVLKG